MSLPPSHAESLERHMRVHEERLTQLRQQLRNAPATSDPNPKGDPNPKPPLPRAIGHRDVLDREIRFHEHLITLARDPRVLKALLDLTVAPDFAREAIQDPRATAKRLGIELPAGRVLRVDRRGSRMRLLISSYEGLYPFLVTWDSERGFSPVPELDVPQRSR